MKSRGTTRRMRNSNFIILLRRPNLDRNYCQIRKKN
jgi:hypothetical protein